VCVVAVHAMKAERESKGTAVLILNLDTRWRWVVNLTPDPLYSRERCPVSFEMQAGWAADPVSTIS